MTRGKLTPEQRRLRARIAAHASWARTTDRSARTAPARAKALDNIDSTVHDPSLSADERQRRIMSARKAHFAQLALRSARARSRGQVDDPFE